jgi:hypothetical protein
MLASFSALLSVFCIVSAIVAFTVIRFVMTKWGLDARNHQDGWDPYAELTSHWNQVDRNDGDADYDENELEVLYF